MRYKKHDDAVEEEKLFHISYFCKFEQAYA
jgi:hypothetical protein